MAIQPVLFLLNCPQRIYITMYQLHMHLRWQTSKKYDRNDYLAIRSPAVRIHNRV